ncbi:MAG: nitroreductase family deazaflavin-dependent oxidoreductase [Gemmatimonadaceae bacterium]
MPNPVAGSKRFHKLSNIGFTWLWKLMPAPTGIAVVTTRGRKSGKARTRAMRAVRDGQRVYAAAILGSRADWLANLRADSRVALKLGTKTYRASGHELTEPTERQEARAVYVPIAGFYDYVDYLSFLWDPPSKSKLIHIHEQWFDRGAPVVFELTDP